MSFRIQRLKTKNYLPKVEQEFWIQSNNLQVKAFLWRRNG